MIRYRLYLDWRAEPEADCDNAEDMRIAGEQALDTGRARYAAVVRVAGNPDGYSDEVVYAGSHSPLRRQSYDSFAIRPGRLRRPSALAFP